jgi:hypothetical protein
VWDLGEIKQGAGSPKFPTLETQHPATVGGMLGKLDLLAQVTDFIA